jgi:hypothetical protein
MKKLIVKVSIGLVGCTRTEEVEVEDWTTEAECEEIAKEVMFEMVEWSFRLADLNADADADAEDDE